MLGAVQKQLYCKKTKFHGNRFTKGKKGGTGSSSTKQRNKFQDYAIVDIIKESPKDKDNIEVYRLVDMVILKII